MTRTLRRARPVILAVVAAAAAALALPAGSAGAAPARGHSLHDDLVARAGGHAAFRAAHGDSGAFFGTAPGHVAKRPSDVAATASPANAAKGWLAHYGSLVAPTGRLVAERVEAVRGGESVARFQQTVSGLPVVGGEVTLALTGSNDLLSLAGHTSHASRVATDAAVSARVAARVAVGAVEKHAGHVAVKPVTRPALSVFDPAVVPSPFVSQATTVWDVDVASSDATVRHRVFVDAHSAKIVADINEDAQATRIVCEPSAYSASAIGTERVADPTCKATPTTEIKPVVSGPPEPSATGDPDVDNAYKFAKAVDDFYLSLLGRNSLDGHGMTLASTVHFCPPNDPSFPESTPCPFPNAFWDGTQMVYGDGYTSGLDVVGHEMTHGVTEHTSNLLSYYQSGAINESESDVMGEMIQQIVGLSSDPAVFDTTKAWQIGEALPGGPFRSMSDPTSDAPADPDSMTSPNYDASAFYTDSWDSGGVHANDGIGNKAAYLVAAGANGDGSPGSFNGVNGITGVSGADQLEKDVKVANIYYTLDKLMWSSTTYADLYNLLPQACNQITTTATVTHDLPLPGGGDTHISAADCAQVVLAVKATKMNVLPTKAGAVAPTAAPFCTNGGYPSKKRLDTFETNPLSASTYKRSHNTASDPFYGQSEIGDWWWSKTKISYYGSAAPVYQRRGSTASLWGDDIDPNFVDPNQTTYSYQDSRIRTATAIKPAIGTFIRFEHAWEFEYGPEVQNGPVRNFDGGRVEYSIDGGKTWYDAGAASRVDKKALIVSNGYNGLISNTTDLSIPYGDPNPLRGHRGFVRSSHGWTASRLDLSSLKGKSVLISWRIGADDQGGSYGWYVDNVETYSCNPTHIAATGPHRVARGKPATVGGHLVRAGTTAPLAKLPVTLWERRHGTRTWHLVSTRTTNRYGNVHWSRTHTTAEDYRVRMRGKRPFAASNYSAETVRLA